MPETLRELDLRIHYEGNGDELLERLVVPALTAAVCYDRLAGYFDASSLVAMARGLDVLRRREGRMRLILGIHDVSPELARARAEDPLWIDRAVHEVRARILDDAGSLTQEFARDMVATLAWMLADGLLDVRVAIPRQNAAGVGIFHPKRLIFGDSSGAWVSAVGSPNETSAGLGPNYEELTVHMSWSDPNGYVQVHRDSFDRLWQDQRPELVVRALDRELAQELLLRLGRQPTAPAAGPARIGVPAPDAIEDLRRSPALALFTVKGANMYPHQERAVLDALCRWPVRVLLADEVGLGKTLEAAAVISYLLRFEDVRRVLVLAPKNLLPQWQEELRDKFGLDFWRYESESHSYISPDGRAAPLVAGLPILNPKSPPRLLVSQQLARGSRRSGGLFTNATVMPDALVVDEAHSARIHMDFDGTTRPTLLWRLVDAVVGQVPHLILLTATPLQLHPAEYHGLLRLMGLPGQWSQLANYEKALDLLASAQRPNLNKANLTASLICEARSTYRPVPSTDVFAEELCELRDRTRRAIVASDRWPETYRALIALHPAHLLTIRNSRANLERMGYRFPRRSLNAPDLGIEGGPRDFYLRIEEYLRDAFGRVEEALAAPERASMGFARSTYWQRLASSLQACRLTLIRRLDRLSEIAHGSELTAEGEDSEDGEDSAALGLSEPDTFARQLEDAATKPDKLAAIRQAATIEATYVRDLLAMANRLFGQRADSDPKIRELMKIIDRHKNADKLLVFSRYTDTVHACLDEFQRVFRGVPHGLYTGQESWIEIDNRRIRAGKTAVQRALQDDLIRVLFCSDAAAEGLNLQAARVLVNVDVPWNPSRLEQRIGRIARLGQSADVVAVYNLWYPESIEARMYTRLIERQDLYELAVGEFPDLIAQTIRDEIEAHMGGDADIPSVDPLETLREMRQTAQFSAMRRIWDVERRDIPFTQEFRRELLHAVVEAAEARGGSVKRLGPDAAHVRFAGHDWSLSSSPGSTDPISLNHELIDVLASGAFARVEDLRLLALRRRGLIVGIQAEEGEQRRGVPLTYVPRLIGAMLRGVAITKALFVDGDQSAKHAQDAAEQWLPDQSALRVVPTGGEPFAAPTHDVTVERWIS